MANRSKESRSVRIDYDQETKELKIWVMKYVLGSGVKKVHRYTNRNNVWVKDETLELGQPTIQLPCVDLLRTHVHEKPHVLSDNFSEPGFSFPEDSNA